MASKEQILEELIEEYHRRKARGDALDPADFREQAGEHFEEFVAFVELDSFIQRATEGTPVEEFPRAFGEYTLLSVLGEGGVGRVYKAIQRKLSRTVALKVLHGGWGADSNLRERFRRGAKAAAQVEHDHVVRVYDHGFEDKRPYMAMSLLEGPSLHEVLNALRETGPVPFGEAHYAALSEAGIPDGNDYTQRTAELVAGVADALAEYHDLGIVHRDVKPGNLMLDKRGRLVLTDFDLAKGLDTQFMTRHGGALGTPAYMSPEQWNPTGHVDNRTDIYSLGAVLYELWTLRRPHQDPDDPTRIRRGPVPDPGDHVPIEATRIVRKCLEQHPDDRYANARSLASDLRALATGGRVKARPAPATRKAWRWVTKRKMAAATVLVAASIAGYFALRPATLSIASTPAGNVWIDGARAGRAPVSVSLPPGPHRISIRLAGYAPHRFLVDLRRGSNLHSATLETVTVRATNALKESHNIVVPEFERLRTDAPILGVLPRGKVQPDDVRFVVQGVSSARVVMVDERGVEWRGTTEESPPNLRVGGRYRWRMAQSAAAYKGVRGPGAKFGVDRPGNEPIGVSEWTEFEVVEPLAIDESEFPEADRALLIAAYYQSYGLHRAAMLVLKEHQAETDARRWAQVFWRSIEALGLTETTLADDVKLLAR